MKALLYLIFCFNLTAAEAQMITPDYQASTGGIGPFKTGLSRVATEKLLNTKLKLPRSSQVDSYELDTIKCTYKEMDMQLVFGRQYFGNDTVPKLGIYSVTSSYPMIKTKSGIGIGDDKMKIIKTYDMYRLDVSPEWTDGKPNPKQGTVTLYDNENPKVLIFYLDNNIITAISCTLYEGG